MAIRPYLTFLAIAVGCTRIARHFDPYKFTASTYLLADLPLPLPLPLPLTAATSREAAAGFSTTAFEELTLEAEPLTFAAN